MNFFSFTVIENEENIELRSKPEFCRAETDSTRTKQPCMDCNSLCAYTMEDLFDSRIGIGINDIKKELKEHSHPMSRKMKAT